MNKPTGIIAPFSERMSRPRLVSESSAAPTAFVVLGMHRSGTSALTRVLSLSGYALPATLMQTAPDNPEGFWESRAICAFNDELLQMLGSQWDDPFAFSPARGAMSGIAAQHERAVQLIRGEFPEGAPLVLKDPRITILYDFWKQALQVCGYEPAPVVCLRHPLEVAASLARRNEFPANKSLLVWLAYQLAAERATRDAPRAFVLYDDLMSDWRGCLDQIERSLGVTLERRDPEVEVMIERFLKPELRHHVVSEQREASSRKAPAWILDAYDWFKSAAHDAKADASALNAVVTEYSRQRKWFGPIMADMRLRLTGEIASATRRAEETSQRLAAAETRILSDGEIHRAHIDRSEDRIRSLSDALTGVQSAALEAEAAASERADALRNEIAARDEHLAALNADQEKASAALKDAHDRLRGTEAWQREKFAAYEAEIAKAATEANGAIAELQDALAQARTDAAAREALARDAEAASRERIAAIESELADADAETASLEARVADLETQILDTNQAYAVEIENRDTEIGRLKALAEAREEEAARSGSVLAALEKQSSEVERRLQSDVDARQQELGRQVYLNGRQQDELIEVRARLTKAEAQAGEAARGMAARIAELEARLVSETRARESDARIRDEKLAGARDGETVMGLRSEIEAIKHTYEKEIARREAEFRSEARHASEVVDGLQSNLFQTQMLARERAQQLEIVTRERHEILSSTAWKLAAPLRWVGGRVPWVSSGWRRVRSRIGAMVRGGKRHPAEAPAPTEPPPVEGHRSVNAITAGNRVAPKAAPLKFDPSPIALYLETETDDPGQGAAWRAHCAAFPLAINPESSSRPDLTLSDRDAEQWIARCAQAGAHLRPVRGAPDVSIIVPVYNQLPFTLSAIASVYALKTPLSYEILLADDGSSDQTRTLTDASLPRVRVIRHPQNLGFLRNCNAAAEQATGGVIVLLNNDVVVLQGWLDELIGTLRDDTRVGFVGSKLLYSNATLQEAGGIVWRDGSAWNYGRNQDPRDPRYCYARETDYCSGASIAIPADLWRRLNGFDATRYENAYFEDVDLAFRIREAGYKVIYQPRSALVHFEGVSSGTDTGQGVKRHQITNGKKFFERWQGVLASNRANGVEPARECERDVRGRVLVIDAVTPTPDHDAGSLVMMEMLRVFRDCGWRTSFVPEDNFAYLPMVSPRLQSAGIEALYWPYFQSVEEILEKRGREFDIVLISRAGPAERHLEKVRRLAPHAKIIFNTVDLHYLREHREASLSNDPVAVKKAEKTKQTELAAVAAADLTVVHSTVEQDILRREVPSGRVTVFPWIAETRPPITLAAERQNILFVGGFRHAPNVDGLRWFLQDVWPGVRAQAPGALLRVVGADAPPEFDKFNGADGVTMMGWVQNLDIQLERARVAIAPLRYGAGVKGKVVSALQTGVPVVCTSIASEGMGLKAGRDVIVADDPKDFASSIVRLLKDDAAWAKLSESGLEFVEANYSRKAARARVLEMIRVVSGIR